MQFFMCFAICKKMFKTVDNMLKWLYNSFMESITLKAYAKINLTLDVLGKRADGYHEIASVMQTVGVFDLIDISIVEEPGIFLTTNRPDLATNDRNIAYRAAQYFMSDFEIKKGIAIHINKYIPIAAGLGGGSSDCAAVLNGINELFGLNISADRLIKTGSVLGADVPFFIRGGTVLVQGMGEKIKSLPKHPSVNIVLARLPVEVSTKNVYAEWSGKTEGQTTNIIREIKAGNIKKIAENLSNDLAPTVIDMHPGILDLITAFRKHKAAGANVTGSGPTVYAYFTTETEGLAAVKNMGEQFPTCEFYLTQPINTDN